MYLLCFYAIILCADAAAHDDSLPPRRYDEAIDNGTFGYYPIWSFATEEDIFAPKTNWLQWDEKCNDGMYYFLTPRGWGLPRPGPMILDWKGDLVWSKHFANDWGGQAYDLMVQEYQGQDYLTFWTGDDRLDSSYEMVHSVDAANDLNADLHEFLLTPDGTALLTAYQKIHHNMSEWRAFDATVDPHDADPNWIWDCIFQEIAVDTKDVVFEWRASRHIDINDTFHDLQSAGNHETPFDWFHMNSAHKDELGNYLVSARYTHSISYIDGQTGEVIWILGGKSNMFMDLSHGLAITFAWQHDAQLVSPEAFPETYETPPAEEGYTTRLLSLFDNTAEDQNYAYGMEHARGLLLEITFPTPGHEPTHAEKSSRNITHLRNLAAKSKQHINKIPTNPNPNLPYPTYTPPSPNSTTTNTNTLKLHQTNSTNPSHTVRVIKSLTNPSRLRSSSQGSTQILPPTSPNPDANILVSYGLNAVFTTFDSNGSVLCDAHYGAVTSWERGDIQSYRVLKFPWVGRPKYPPRMVLGEGGGRGFVSWNGATEVGEWVLQSCGNGEEGRGEGCWVEVGRKRREGFETFFEIGGDAVPVGRFLRVLALGVDGEVLEYGVSDVLDREFEQTGTEEADAGAPSQVDEPASKALGQEMPSSTILLSGFFIVLAMLTLYEVYRRYLCWKVGRPAVGAVRWRKGSGYRLLGDA